MMFTREELLEAADILDAAHDVILDKGWWPGNDNDSGKSSRCMEAAVVEVLAVERLHPYAPQCTSFDDRSSLLKEYPVLKLLKLRGIDCDWNDIEGRRDDEVFDRLRTVAKELREEAGL